MLASNHPDFIEMDAASHTGVDSVRQIIESCTYMPLTGSKKIYLIDEAHMLSKAAFNAFLKILEEPPLSTIFILATTETQKIPETVRSRCFQVLFNPVENTALFDHLEKICTQEDIDAQPDALKLLIRENDGSVRDAINTLEQVRFSGEIITKDLVLKSLGKISETQLHKLFTFIVNQNPKELLEHLQAIQYESLSAQSLWGMVVDLLRSLLWVKYGVAKDEQLISLAENCSVERVHALLQIMWTQESLFLQTPKKHLFLETVLLQMTHQVNIESLQTLVEHCKNAPVQQGLPVPQAHRDVPPRDVFPRGDRPAPQSHHREEITLTDSRWSNFLTDIEKGSNDPLLSSIFKQARFLGQNDDATQVKLQLSGNNSFFRDKIAETREFWESIIKRQFPLFISFSFEEGVIPLKETAPRGVSPRGESSDQAQSQAKKPTSTPINIVNAEKWPKTTLLTQAFSGKLERVETEEAK